MQTLKVLARKDAYSVLVAIIVGLSTNSFIYSIAFLWSSKIVVQDPDVQVGFVAPNSDWRTQYLVPMVGFILSLLILEFLLQVINYANSPSKKK